MTYVGNIENSQHLIYILAMKYECLTCLSTYNTAYKFVIPETFKFAQLYDVEVPKPILIKCRWRFKFYGLEQNGMIYGRCPRNIVFFTSVSIWVNHGLPPPCYKALPVRIQHSTFISVHPRLTVQALIKYQNLYIRIKPDSSPLQPN